MIDNFKMYVEKICVPVKVGDTVLMGKWKK